jgi:tetratricopeptide (TPR) repeat protein
VAEIEALRTYLNHFPFAVANAPDRMSLQIKIGTLYKEMQRYDEAIAYFRTILIEANPGEQIEIQFYIGECLYQQKKYTCAIEELLKILDFGGPLMVSVPFHTNARWLIAQSFKELGAYDQAVPFLDAIMKSYPPTNTFYIRAQAEKETILELMRIKK